KKNSKTPVTVVGGINSPEFAEQIIADGKVDFVSLGRQCIADPDFANKAMAGREDEIRRCMRCYHCYGEHPGPGNKPRGSVVPHFGNFTLSNLLNGVQNCSINPKANQEVIIKAMPEPKGSRRVMIVGGGAGGMQAAITAADRGHQVTLVEKSAGLGGILSFTDTDVHKVDLKNFKDLLIREVNKKNINVLLNTVATPELIAENKPDALVLAVGAEPAKPNIPGLDGAMPVLDAYKTESKIGKNVVMLGGGLAGCETAVHLADKGHNVTIVEMLTTLASEIGGMPYDALMNQIEKRKNITVRLEAKCVAVTPDGVKVECGAGAPELIKGDTVIYSLGMSARKTEVEKLKEAAGQATVFEVGDCVRGARVFEAVREGYMAAMKIV
ncbi:MAG: FAD-dependent oxidoreductase, partial [Dehalococcoidales bacterium]|nr:FAD-dependent oxidoreductase [Dehalococcoidales bacterium]